MFKYYLVLFSFACALNLNAQVIDYTIDPSFDSDQLFNRGSVSDILSTANSQYFIMGMFQGWGSPISTGSIVDQLGNLIQANIIGGQKLDNYKDGFLQYGSLMRRFSISDGVLSDFNFSFEYLKPAYSGFLSRKALDALVLPDDEIIVAGRFFTDSNTTAESLRHLCVIDSTGAPLEEFPMVHCAQPIDAEIYTVDTLSDGSFIIAGQFNEVNGEAYSKIAKLNTDFTVDTSFSPVFGNSGTVVGVTLIDSQDRIWASFGPNITVLGQPEYASRIIRILPDGTIDPSFTPPICTGYFSGTYEDPVGQFEIGAEVFEDSDDTYILHGSFTELNGEAHRRIGKIEDNGTVIPNAMQYTTADSAIWGSWVMSQFGPVMGASIGHLERLPDGKLLLGGQFSSFGGEPYSCLVRLMPNGFVGLDEKEGRGELKLWPNPVSLSAGAKSIQISLPSKNENIHLVEIADLQGAMVLGQAIHAGGSNATLKIEQLPPGLYVVRAQTPSSMYTQKLVITD